MNVFRKILEYLRQVFGRMIPSKSIEQAEHIDTPISNEMQNALELWYEMYLDQAPWLETDTVKSMNLASFISSEIARQVTLEMKWNITGKDKNGNTSTEDGEDVMNPRAQYLKDEFEKLITSLRLELEQGCAAGGMTILPYVNLNDKHIYFSYTMDWELFPVAFGADGNRLDDVIFQDQFIDGKTYYTRLERHQLVGKDVHITQQAFKSSNENYLGTPINLTEVERWKSLKPEITIKDTDGQLFGWFKVAAANTIDANSPMGASCFAKAAHVIEEADKQYSRLLWEFEGSELAIDVDPTALRPRTVQESDGKVHYETPKLNQRLFRQVDIDKGDRDLYEVFSPQIRDSNILNGLNQLMMRIEDLTGLSRGTLSDANSEARTATELKIMKQRSYATISDNQRALERCLRDVVRAMDKYATIYHLAPEGDYDVSFNWDDSILTDTDSQANEWFTMLNSNIVSKAEFREWYFGETKAQAKSAIDAVTQESVDSMQAMQAGIQLPGGSDNGGGSGATPSGQTPGAPSQAGEE